ncbi:hypothetical protein [Dactylosporangium sp. CA-139066]|uniref:hypothetical protein n=1 Tax=Dactylosporangium sp. CA-139066 TaxID=3239930 RepID=UPI003D8FE116
MSQPQSSTTPDPDTSTMTQTSQLTGIPTRSTRRGGARLRVAVVGGSLTGPAAALLLLHAGFDDVAVYEAVPASAPQGRRTDRPRAHVPRHPRPPRRRPGRVR